MFARNFYVLFMSASPKFLGGTREGVAVLQQSCKLSHHCQPGGARTSPVCSAALGQEDRLWQAACTVTPYGQMCYGVTICNFTVTEVKLFVENWALAVFGAANRREVESDGGVCDGQ
ncbi:hypothetical protein M758_7G063600 [Ceratodon purpureus]|nr:hypothetical protein M758_7G063600 [Ceratodon purpureus]